MSTEWSICLALSVAGCGGCNAPGAKTTGREQVVGAALTEERPSPPAASSVPEAGPPSAGAVAAAGTRAPQVAACRLGAVGVFEEITPPVVKAGIGQKFGGQTKGGTFAMAVDPINQGTVYAGTLFQGLWKTKDCGSSWKLIATGSHGADVNRGMNWTLAIDPVTPDVVYTNSGYGSNGLFKSSDGGVNWDDIWSGASQPVLGKAFEYNFANVVAIDPYDHRHLLLTFHEACRPPHPTTCIVESHDAGASWKMLDGEPGWNGNEGQVIFFLENSSTWLWGSQSNGFWRTDNSGKSWQRIPGMQTTHLQGSQILRAKDGSFYAAAADGIWHSPDGTATTWKLMPGTGSILGGLVSDGTTLYASTAYFTGVGPTKYLRSPETDGKTWEVMKSPTLQIGGNLGYDPGHKLLYSSNLDSGLWRVVVR